MGRHTSIIHTINAATATTTGQPINIEGASAVTFFFKRSNHSSGSTAFTVEVTPNLIFENNGTIASADWVQYNKLISNATNTNAQGLTRLASVSLSSNTVVTVTMDLGQEVFEHLRVIATETTDGTHDAWVVVRYDE